MWAQCHGYVCRTCSFWVSQHPSCFTSHNKRKLRQKNVLSLCFQLVLPQQSGHHHVWCTVSGKASQVGLLYHSRLKTCVLCALSSSHLPIIVPLWWQNCTGWRWWTASKRNEEMQRSTAQNLTRTWFGHDAVLHAVLERSNSGSSNKPIFLVLNSCSLLWIQMNRSSIPVEARVLLSFRFWVSWFKFTRQTFVCFCSRKFTCIFSLFVRRSQKFTQAFSISSAYRRQRAWKSADVGKDTAPSSTAWFWALWTIPGSSSSEEFECWRAGADSTREAVAVVADAQRKLWLLRVSIP